MRNIRMLKRYLILGVTMMITCGVLAGGTFADQSATRIKGGNQAAADTWLGVVALIDAGQNAYLGQFGSGALIHPYWVVTSARNVMWAGTGTPKSPEDIDVFSGDYDLLYSSAERIKVKQIVVHPDFDHMTNNADIALLELETPSPQAVLSMASGIGDDAGLVATVLGWGLADNDDFPSILQEIELPVVSRQDAETVFPDTTLTDTMMFAGYADNTNGPCLYDTGAPLIVNVDGVQQLAAVFSWNNGCDQAGAFGVYTSVASLRDFIDAHVPVFETTRILPFIISGGGLDTVLEMANPGDSAAQCRLIPKSASGEMVSEIRTFSLEPGITIELSVGNDFLQPHEIHYMVMETTSDDLDLQIRYTSNGMETSAYSAPPSDMIGDITISDIRAGTDHWTLICLVNPTQSHRSVGIEFDTGDVRSIELASGESRLFSITELFDALPQPEISSALIKGADNIVGVRIISELGGTFEEMILTEIAGATEEP